MKRKLLFLTLLAALAVGLAGCGPTGQKPGGEQNRTGDTGTNKPIKGDVGNNTCQGFSADFIYSAANKPVVRVEPDLLMPEAACRYYFTYDKNFYKDIDNPVLRAGGAHIFMMVENMNVADQKKGVEFLGATTKSDSRIKMENMITLRKNGSIWDIKLIINPNRYLRMDYSNKAMTDEELINFAAKVADYIQGRKIDLKNNPAQLIEDKPADLGGSQQAVAEQFLNLLAVGKFTEAIALMDATDQTKQMWLDNFKTIKSLKVKKTEEAFKAEWTPERQTYKFTLDVSVTPAGEQIGWENGTNFRWVTLQKSGDKWLVHELANNP